MEIKILPSVTTFQQTNINTWQDKIAEIDKFDLKEVALFLTSLPFEKRPELYRALETTNLQAITFVHIKTDVTVDELDYLSGRWGTRVFNHHCVSTWPLDHDISKYFPKLYIENTEIPLADEELEGKAGICLDFSHLEDARRSAPEIFKQWLGACSKHPVGCGHVSAVREDPWQSNDPKDFPRYSRHDFKNLSEFDYLANYPLVMFPKFIAIELENSLEDQLKVREYIENLLKYLKK
jgi:hypothetical protein